MLHRSTLVYNDDLLTSRVVSDGETILSKYLQFSHLATNHMQ